MLLQVGVRFFSDKSEKASCKVWLRLNCDFLPTFKLKKEFHLS
jgi:hypothetical protein